MNRIYRIVWNAARSRWQAVGEMARGAGKAPRTRSRKGPAFMLTSLLLFPVALPASGLPAGATVVAGNGSMEYDGDTLTITQNGQRLAIDWERFSIGRENRVEFLQPGGDAAALNRVIGSDPSTIQGALQANGQVFLVNPNGITFTGEAQVDAGGLVASTLDIDAGDFVRGDYTFEGDHAGAIVNQGNIHADEYIAMIAARIDNPGSLHVEAGSVVMGAGRKVTLDMGGPVGIEVEEKAVDALIENGGAIKADGGHVYLTARAAGDLASTVINNDGIIEARTLASGENGEIYLMGDMQNDRIRVGGVLDAGAPDGGDGGLVETSAASVDIQPGLTVTTDAPRGRTGEWLIDPYDFTIADSGGDITPGQLVTALDASNVTITTEDTGVQCTNTSDCGTGSSTGNGDIFVDDAVSWSTNVLALNAYRDIVISAPLDGRAEAGLDLKAATSGSGKIRPFAAIRVDTLRVLGGDWEENKTNLASLTVTDFQIGSGANFLRVTGGAGTETDPYRLVDAYGLQGMTSKSDYADAHWELANDIDLAETQHWNGGAGWKPLESLLGLPGDRATLDGNGHTISNLTINRPASTYIGFFEKLEDVALVRDLALTNVNVTGNKYVGGLVGSIRSGEVDLSNVSVSGQVSGNAARVGGIAGQSIGNIVNAHANVSVSGPGDGSSAIGGLVGRLVSNGSIVQSSSEGAVTAPGDTQVGGLVGSAEGGSTQIRESSASGNVSGSDTVGGLVGWNEGGNISQSFATGNVSATGHKAGGLIGVNQPSLNQDPLVEDVYATGNVTGDGFYAAGLVGLNEGEIRNAYATGTVAGNLAGALIGKNEYLVENAFWLDGGLAGIADEEDGAVEYQGAVQALSESAIRSQAPFRDAGWDIAQIDAALPRDTPVLGWQAGTGSTWVIAPPVSQSGPASGSGPEREPETAARFHALQSASQAARSQVIPPAVQVAVPAEGALSSIGGLSVVEVRSDRDGSGAAGDDGAPAPLPRIDPADSAYNQTVFVIDGGIRLPEGDIDVGDDTL